jgi:hypothetical protein
MTDVRGGESEIRGKTRNNVGLTLRLNCMSELKKPCLFGLAAACPGCAERKSQLQKN